MWYGFRVAIREIAPDDEALDPMIALALVILAAIMATGIVFAVLVHATVY